MWRNCGKDEAPAFVQGKSHWWSAVDSGQIDLLEQSKTRESWVMALDIVVGHDIPQASRAIWAIVWLLEK